MDETPHRLTTTTTVHLSPSSRTISVTCKFDGLTGQSCHSPDWQQPCCSTTSIVSRVYCFTASGVVTFPIYIWRIIRWAQLKSPLVGFVDSVAQSRTSFFTRQGELLRKPGQRLRIVEHTTVSNYMRSSVPELMTAYICRAITVLTFIIWRLPSFGELALANPYQCFGG